MLVLSYDNQWVEIKTMHSELQDLSENGSFEIWLYRIPCAHITLNVKLVYFNALNYIERKSKRNKMHSFFREIIHESAGDFD